MTNLVQSLQKQALSGSISPSDLLRHAKFIAKKLNIDDFANWTDRELNGYFNIDDIPEYRKTQGSLEAWNPYQGWKPVSIPEKEIEDVVLAVHITQSIAEVEKLALEQNSQVGPLVYKLSGAQEQQICNAIDFQTNIRKVIASTVLDNIVNNIKNIILDWSIKLEKEGITCSEIEFSIEERKIAKANPSINITNFSGILGDVSQSHINQNINNSVNDVSELNSLLSKYGVKKKDLDDINTCLQTDPPPKKPNLYGKKVSGWLGKMIKKAAMGTWEIGINIASDVLSRAINKYYGF